MTAEAGHLPNRVYLDQSGDFHLNGASFFNDAEADIADSLEVLNSLSPAELSYLDGVTAGTVTASKAAVVDANKDLGDFRNLDCLNLDAGASGAAGTVDVFPSTASKGKLSITAADSAGDTTTRLVNASQAGARTYTIPDAGADADFVMTAGDQTIAGNKTLSASLKSSAGVGAVAGTGVTVAEYGDGNLHKTVFTFADVAIALTDEAGVIAYGGLKFYDFPEGLILVLAAVADLDLTKSSAGVNDDWDGDFGLGTATAGNDADLTSTEQDILPKTATPQAAAGATTANGQNAAVAFLDGTTTAKDAFVNFIVDDADHDVTSTPCNLILNGTITLIWVNGGDY